MEKFIKVQKYNTSEGETFLIWNFDLAEKFFSKKPDSFNAVFAGEETIKEDDYGFYFGGMELKEIEDGIFY